MNINSIQSLQISQNAVSAADRGSSNTGSAHESSFVTVSSEARPAHASESGLAAGTGFLKAQLDELLTSFPPFFPIGSYQRSDLIRRIKTLEEQVGKSVTDNNIRQLFSKEKLNEKATDTEISASLDRLLAVRDKLTENKGVSPENVNPGSLIEVTA